jgi:NAD+ synthase
MKVSIAQIDITVGDFEHNFGKIKSEYEKFKNDNDLIIYPELAICGYPPEDLVLRKEFRDINEDYTKKVIALTKGNNCDILIGTVISEENQDGSAGRILNSAILISDGEVKKQVNKFDLPNYGIFDEKRVFNSANRRPRIFKYRDKVAAILICEDFWNLDNIKHVEDAEVIFAVNASPFEKDKNLYRLEQVAGQAFSNSHAEVIFYSNQSCGVDDLIFDGGSFVAERGKENNIRYFQMKRFEEDTQSFEISSDNKIKSSVSDFTIDQYRQNKDVSREIYQACMQGLKSYVEKNGFKGVALGLSGGVDSAISAAIAIDTLGQENVKLFLLPSKFTSDESFDDAKEFCKRNNIELSEVNIEKIKSIALESLEDVFEGTTEGVTEENIQSRIRGLLLMAVSNKFGNLLVTTGNKSEVSVGYSTVYGDMCGGYNLIKDIYKTEIFELCRWRNDNIPQNSKNSQANVIPENIIVKAPTAELRENQKDEDSLPPYETLDKILYHLTEGELSAEEIEAKGFNRDTIEEVEKLLFRAEHKRRQSAPGVKISSKPFGRDRRYPITNKLMEY